MGEQEAALNKLKALGAVTSQERRNKPLSRSQAEHIHSCFQTLLGNVDSSMVQGHETEYLITRARYVKNSLSRGEFHQKTSIAFGPLNKLFSELRNIIDGKGGARVKNRTIREQLRHAQHSSMNCWIKPRGPAQVQFGQTLQHNKWAGDTRTGKRYF